MVIQLNVAVGGTLGFFPDNVQNQPYPKPWCNSCPDAGMANRKFWEAKDQWYPDLAWGERLAMLWVKDNIGAFGGVKDTGLLPYDIVDAFLINLLVGPEIGLHGQDVNDAVNFQYFYPRDPTASSCPVKNLLDAYADAFFAVPAFDFLVYGKYKLNGSFQEEDHKISRAFADIVGAFRSNRMAGRKRR
nr:hypothetical protein BaRGS_022559 [Batillaria attramentaria]